MVKIYTAKKRTTKGRAKRYPKPEGMGAMVRKGVIQLAEKKFHNWAHFGNVGADGLECYQLNAIAVGTSDSTRIGDRIHPISLEVNLTTEVGAAAGITYPGTIRMVVIKVNENKAAVPTYSEVFNSAYATGIWAASAPRNMDKKSKYQILADVQYECGYGSKASQFNKLYITKGLSDCQYVAGSSTSGINNLYVMLISSNNSVNEATFKVNGQLRFVDL